MEQQAPTPTLQASDPAPRPAWLAPSLEVVPISATANNQIGPGCEGSIFSNSS